MARQATGARGWRDGHGDGGRWNTGGWARRAGGQWGRVAEAEAFRTVHAAVDLGVKLFDTADASAAGVSEELVGKALRNRPDHVYIATKVGNFGRRQDAAPGYTSPLHVYLCCDASLGRLQIDAIDLYQCHIGDVQDPTFFLEAFERLVERGKIRAYGSPTDSLAVARAFNRDGKCATLQLNYSLLNRAPELPRTD
ncbi:MAG: hypothetical protein AVDCRST_MAG18-31 [uncultured Thermomicrobiales bacterium]|uniref:NADP-dependent oxidoreductase domain-containing protein n=1 Tax=uncultured Thermomicrobiales bacterium TaxID=1645740 RepID=A0A6J4UDD5_9BACT|nr:MAG: hypothetical protein AVDCRST_MAG18-31 [uncultured Thermomicrobiales bacterium]